MCFYDQIAVITCFFITRKGLPKIAALCYKLNNHNGVRRMAKVVTTEERIKKARALIEKARNLPPPTEHGWMDLSFTANVKDLLRQARDLVKFVQFMPNAAAETKQEVEALMLEISSAEKEILHKS